MKSSIENTFKRLLKIFDEEKIRFALAGGWAASIYRSNARFTRDIDFAIWTEGNIQSQVKSILSSLKLTPVEIREAQLKGGPMFAIKRKSTPIWMICGHSDDENQIPVDFLLPAIPWVMEALDRAQKNLVDIGLGRKIPCLTKEDLLISKIMAASSRSDRLMDLDDIIDITKHQSDINWTYVVGKMRLTRTTCPRSLEKILPPIVRKVSKQILSEIRNSKT